MVQPPDVLAASLRACLLSWLKPWNAEAQKRLIDALNDNDSLDRELLRRLLHSGANLNKPHGTRFAATVLYHEVTRDHLNNVSLLLDGKADVNRGIVDGPSPLQYCMQRGCISMARKLISARADVNLALGGIMSPIVFACFKEHTACVHMLIEAGVDVNQRCTVAGGAGDDVTLSALHIAATRKIRSVEITRLLLEAKANVNVTDEQGRSPLFVSCMNSSSCDAFPEVVALLLSFGADMEQTMAGCNVGATPLYGSAIHGQPRAVRVLLEAHANVHVQTAGGATPMLAAVQEGFLEIVQLLSSYGAPRDGHMQRYVTAEGFAEAYGCLEVLQWLKESRHYSTLAHVDVLSEERARRDLTDPKTSHRQRRLAFKLATARLVHLRPSLNLDRLDSLRVDSVGPELAAAATIVKASMPWSMDSHALWPVTTQRWVSRLCRMGHLIASRRLPIGNQASFTDAFVHHVIPHLVTPPKQRRQWGEWLRQETRRQRLRDNEPRV